MKVETVAKYVASPKTRKASGIHATFVKINRKWGFKYFCDMDMRDFNYEIMSNLAELGIAAKVGQKMDLVLGGETYYGFVIEVCKPCVTEILKFSGFSPKLDQGNDYYLCAVPDGKYYKAFMAVHPEWAAQFVKLKQRCHRADFDWTDDHSGNWGLTTDGEPVIFDVSVEAEERLYDDEDV